MPFGGLASVRVNIAGVRSAPLITIDGSLDRPRFGDVRLDRATLGGSYVARRLQAKAELFRRERSVLAVNASIPVDLALASVPTRMLADSLHGNIRSDSVELAILETVSPAVLNASGTFAANLDIGGDDCARS